MQPVTPIQDPYLDLVLRRCDEGGLTKRQLGGEKVFCSGMAAAGGHTETTEVRVAAELHDGPDPGIAGATSGDSTALKRTPDEVPAEEPLVQYIVLRKDLTAELEWP